MLASLNPQIHDFSGPQSNHAPNEVITSDRPKLAMSGQEAITCHQSLPSDAQLSIRGYSDSVVPSARSSKVKEQGLCDFNGLSQNDLAAPAPLYRDGTKTTTMAIKVKARANLHLPSFKSLGISSRIPEPLFTPPDEDITPRPASPPCLFSRSSSYPPTNMPNTPSPDRVNPVELTRTTILGKESSITPTPSTLPVPATSAELHDTVEEQHSESREPGDQRDEADSAYAGWIASAVQSAVLTIDPEARNVIYVLCHSQPCPLPNQAPESEAVTAIHDILSGIQTKINTNNRYIHVTHAIPVKFSMNQIPNSPAATPSMQNTMAAATDYFNLPTNVFSNAVIAPGHQNALETSVPSSPCLVVPPTSVNISLLERYIPPSSSEEFLDLFLPEGQSPLVARLIELSPNGGNLIFIYPTATGASTFANTYLGPLLHPHLRTMCSIHNLSMDFGAGVGSIAAIEHMLSFEALSRKIEILLRKLGRQTSTIRQAPKYSLIHSNKQHVDLERKTWTEWWAQQETPRMRNVVERYLKRGTMLPTRIAGQEVTAAALVQEVLDGVKESRSYADYDEDRRGVEVGVFVIKRTA